jgi:hypothetical protein
MFNEKSMKIHNKSVRAIGRTTDGESIKLRSTETGQLITNTIVHTGDSHPFSRSVDVHYLIGTSRTQETIKLIDGQVLKEMIDTKKKKRHF